MPTSRAARRTFVSRLVMLGFVTVVSFVAGGLIARPAATATPPTIAIDADAGVTGVQTDATYAWGIEEIAIPIVVTDAQPTGAFEFIMAFDPAVLAYRRTTAGPFIGSTGRVPACVEASTPTTVNFGCGSIGPVPPGPAGDGVLAVVYMHPIVPAHTCFSLVKVGTATVAGDSIDTGKQDACVTITDVQTPTSTAASGTSTSVATQTSSPAPTSTTGPTDTPTIAATAPASATAASTETAIATATAQNTPAATATLPPTSAVGRVLTKMTEIRDRLCDSLGNTSTLCRALSRVTTRFSLRFDVRVR